MAVDYAPTFERLGVPLWQMSADHAIGECPFCGKEEHFYVNTDSGQWDCKVCGEKGNIYGFLGKIAQLRHEETPKSRWGKLENLRGIPATVFQRFQMGWFEGEWWIPIKNEKGTVVDIRRWNGERTQSTDGCRLHIFNLQEMIENKDRGDVWICEGEWDAIALDWMFKLAKSRDVVVGIPGAGVFKKSWTYFFQRMNVIVAYDNDSSGISGSHKVGEVLKPFAKSIRYIRWPAGKPLKYDVRDFVLESRAAGQKSRKIIEGLRGLIQDEHLFTESGTESAEASEEELELASFQEVVNVFKKWVKVDDSFIESLAVVLAVCLGNEIPGDPIWIYLVAPPGSGKTLLLMSTKSSSRTMFRSTLTTHSLVSGFNVGKDPSLLPQLDGKTAVFKDGTELLAMQPDSRREAYSILRGAYDGHVHKSFGNGVVREYNVHFNMIIGTTPAVQGDNLASMGERFLKFNMKETELTQEAKIRQAIQNISKEVAMEDELSTVCKRFLARQVSIESLPEIPDRMVDRIVALSRIVATMRTQVDRDSFGDRDIKYKPVHEIGTRIAKQMAKLGQMLAIVFDTKVDDDRVYRILAKTAVDSCIGLHFEIVKSIFTIGDQGASRDAISELTKLPNSTVYRRLLDLVQLGLIERSPGIAIKGKRGPYSSRWKLNKDFLQLWKRAFHSQTDGELPYNPRTGLKGSRKLQGRLSHSHTSREGNRTSQNSRKR